MSLQTHNGLPQTESLESVLKKLALFGDPRLGKFSRGKPGWHCHVEIFATGKGISFDVASDFDSQTPLEAAQMCLDRLDECLTGLKQLAT